MYSVDILNSNGVYSEEKTTTKTGTTKIVMRFICNNKKYYCSVFGASSDSQIDEYRGLLIKRSIE